MKIIVTGKNGQVGHELMRSLAPLGEVVGIDVEDCDLNKPAAIEKMLAHVKPDLIVNPAAYTAVDKAESEANLAHAVNAAAPEVLAKYAASKNIPIIHYSTDYVFDGTKDGLYVETDKANPKSVYGKTKYLGEAAVRNNAPKHVILRTSWVFGSHGVNFLKTMLKLAQERDALRVVADQVGAPTSAELIAETTAQIMRQMVGLPEDDPRWGVYHLTAGGATNWHAYASYVIAQARAAGWPIKVADEAIAAIRTEDYPVAATRPMNSCLDTTKLRAAFGVSLPDWRVGVDGVLAGIRRADEV
jgi:dTDP-4-dehydrorhamnose reductase